MGHLALFKLWCLVLGREVFVLSIGACLDGCLEFRTFHVISAADILPHLNTSVKGTAVDSILFAPVPCRASIRSEQLIYSSQFHVTSVLWPRSFQLAPPFCAHSFFPAVSCSLRAFPLPPSHCTFLPPLTRPTFFHILRRA